jgi:uncharacterized protein (DUF58 family)
MGSWIALAIAMAVTAAAANAPGVMLIAVLTIAYGALATLWVRYGIARIEYSRGLATNRAVAGDSVPLDIVVWNRKALPLPWVTAEDRLGLGLNVRERPVLRPDEDRPGLLVLRNDWTLAWYERVVRHFHLDRVRRGAYRLGPVQLSVRDIFGRVAAEEEVGTADILTVAPKTAAVRHAEHNVSPLGERRARSSLSHDPALIAGVRPFQPGDSVRQIHWRATARLGSLVSRRTEPARGRDVILVLDVQTTDGAVWLAWDEDLLESLCVAAASLARHLLADGASVGVAAASFAGSPQRFAWLAPRASLAQLPRVGELLARIGPIPSGPMTGLLTWLTRRVPASTSMILITARDPAPFLAAVRRMKRLGYGTELVMIGPDASGHAPSVRAGGLRVVTGSVDPGWQDPDAVSLAG